MAAFSGFSSVKSLFFHEVAATWAQAKILLSSAYRKDKKHKVERR
jgi:hypothetical protein